MTELDVPPGKTDRGHCPGPGWLPSDDGWVESPQLVAALVPIHAVKPYRNNPRRGDVAGIAESLKAHGQYKPIVANERTTEVLVGNHTLLAARSLGWLEVAVAWVNVDDDEAARIVLHDNKTSDGSSYDETSLAELLASLPDLSGTGWADPELDALLGRGEPVRLTDPDDAPDVPTTPPRCKAGQVWDLGPHRLAVGDCTDWTLIRRLLQGDGPAALFLTDPPYGVSYEGGMDGNKVLNDELRDEKLFALLLDSFRLGVKHLRPGAPFYIFGPSNEQQLQFRLACREVGMRLRAELVWVKNALVMGRSDYQLKHESLMVGHAPLEEPAAVELEHDVFFYGWKDGAPHPWSGGRKQTSVLEYPKPRRSKEHPTMKPVEMLEQLIRNSTEFGDLVLDWFGGSGSTMIAGHGTGRVTRLVELWPNYADVICRRYQEHTGIVPRLDGEPVDFTVPLGLDR